MILPLKGKKMKIRGKKRGKKTFIERHKSRDEIRGIVQEGEGKRVGAIYLTVVRFNWGERNDVIRMGRELEMSRDT